MTIDRNSNSDEFEDESLNTGSDKVFQNYLMPGLELFDAKVTINHWQLRDCIKPSSRDQSQLYYIYDHSIRVLNTDSSNLIPDDHPNYKSTYSSQNKKLKYRNIMLRRHSIYQQPSSSPNYLKSDTIKFNHRTPSKKLVEFNFKPRCFTELNGLTACGGLIGLDDKGFPTNWNRLSHADANNNNNNSIRTSRSPIPSPAQPIKVASSGVLMDNSNYSNSNIWKGILSLYNENLDSSLTVILGQFINNCVSLFETSKNNYNLYTCNNDSHIYQCDISNRDIQLVKRYSDLKFPLNNSALSHDGRTMVVSGDSNKFAIYHQDELVNQFTLNYNSFQNSNFGTKSDLSKLSKQTRFNLPDISESVDQNIFTANNGDHGFYNCFSENDLQFATLFQNGICLVYDIRNTTTPLAEISSTRPHSHNGAFRVCRFSYGLDDLLFISEHQGRVHVVDTRNFTNHQVIMIPDTIESMNNRNSNGTTISTNEPRPSNLQEIENRRLHQASIFPITDSSLTSSIPSTNSLFTTGTTNRRRFSAPTSTADIEPWITPAMSIPLKYLEPKIVPYPKVMDKSSFHTYNNRSSVHTRSNTYNNNSNRTHTSAESASSSSFSLDSSNESLTRDNIHNNTDQYIPRSNERISFRVRRVSTSGNDEPNLSIDPAITQTGIEENPLIDHLESALPSRAQRFNDYINGRGDSSFNDYSNDSNLFANYYASELNTRSVLEFSDNDFVDENNISGIDWIQDRNGSSLIIGTDYGIMKWNINSWARRSFSSYDFC